MKVYCATSNSGKLREFQLIVDHYSQGQITIEPIKQSPPEETGETFIANASQKAAYYSRHADGYVFADDSGLSVDALNGAPGVFSARYAGENATDAANNAKLLEALAPAADRTARFVCAIAVASSGTVLATFEAHVEGQIVYTPQGPNGFGYDPLFFYPPFNCTFGEAPPERKLLVSHRGKAMAKMIEWLLRQ